MGGPMGNGMGQPQGMMAQAAPTPAPAQNEDDFGDFADAGKDEAKPAVSSDPLSKLISLDGLSKNTKDDKAAKLNQPILANNAAASYQSEKSAIDDNMKQGMQHANIGGGMDSFAGLGNMGSGGAGNTMAAPMMGMNNGYQGNNMMGGAPMMQGGMGQPQGMNMQQMQGQNMGMNSGFQGNNMMGGSPMMQGQGMNNGFQGNNMMGGAPMMQGGMGQPQGMNMQQMQGQNMGGMMQQPGMGQGGMNMQMQGQNMGGMNNNMNNFSSFQ